ncbi:MAG: tRNA lysidine(34) synthetase TilS [Bdellovibrionales bacterium]|nr:tRNA lysidine(34) synthetase TilS [Bdellovibrionales bacterium]
MSFVLSTVTAVKRTQGSHIGGQLIRKIFATSKRFNAVDYLQVSETSDILIAFSGGQDSTALAHLLAHQAGKKGAALRKRLVLAHVNHGWRGADSDADEAWAKATAKAWGVRLISHRLKAKARAGESKEAVAHHQRRQIFDHWLSDRNGAWLLTAHHQNDLAETIFWRMTRGEHAQMPEGIRFQEGRILRPFLEVSKDQIIQYLHEVKQDYREDATNRDLAFQRNRIRHEILPAIEQKFPAFSEQLARVALQAQDRAHHESRSEEVSGEDFPWSLLERKEGLQIRRGQRQSVQRIRSRPKDGKGHRRLQLSGGWHLKQDQIDSGELERWVLTRSQVR